MDNSQREAILQERMQRLRDLGAELITFQYTPNGVWCIAEGSGIKCEAFAFNERNAVRNAIEQAEKRRLTRELLRQST